jgi:hypothetical protein
VSDIDPSLVDPSAHHEELIEEAGEPAVIAAEELEAQQAEFDHEEELARLDAAKARSKEHKAHQHDHDGDG